ncbi:MAG: TonB-dependent receptor plug domain-containing protein, partial [Calditrichaeota bacterium]|nr:TonB-dependent receptor plug domain-containing protein [Calditrichota bacterium]
MLFVFYFSLLFSQDFIISGYVRDKTNSPIDYVNVSVPGLQLGSVTDSDGFFRFKVNQLPLVLVFDHLLYEQQHIRITVENHTEIQVSLKDKVGQADIQFVSATRILKQRSLQRQIVKEDIQEIGGYELADVLRSQSSLTVTSDQQVRMQGLDPEYNLILLDGEPLLSGDESGVSLNSMNSQFIDQVEILQGAASFLYGSGAIAGVINIKSKPIPEQLQIGSNAWCEQKNLAADFSISNTYDRLKIQFNSSYLDGKRDFDERPQNRYQFRSRFIYELNDQSQLNAIFSQNTQKIESSDDSGTIRSQRGQIGLNYQLYYSKTNEFRLSINNNRYSSTDLISGGDNLQ